MKNIDSKSHWNNVYDNKQVEQLGWYESDPEPSLSLIEKLKLKKDSIIFNAGAGATTLVDKLLDTGYTNILINDISVIALEKLKSRLGANSNKVRWVVDDLTQAGKLLEQEKVDLWHDRAVLHFFIDERSRKSYFDLLKTLLKPDGFVIIAVFNLNGATKCSGLPVYRYNADMLLEQLGPEFSLIDSFDHNYTMPSGDSRKYIYTLFKRNK